MFQPAGEEEKIIITDPLSFCKEVPLLKGKEYHTSEAILLKQGFRLVVATRLLLAWVSNEPNNWFVSELVRRNEKAFVTRVWDKENFFCELTDSRRFYNIYFLADTGDGVELENLTEGEIGLIENLLKEGSPIGRELILSGYSLKYAPMLERCWGWNIGVPYPWANLSSPGNSGLRKITS